MTRRARALDAPSVVVLRLSGNAGLCGWRAAQGNPSRHRVRQAPEHVRLGHGRGPRGEFQRRSGLEGGGQRQHHEPVLIPALPLAKRQSSVGVLLVFDGNAASFIEAPSFDGRVSRNAEEQIMSERWRGQAKAVSPRSATFSRSPAAQAGHWSG
ncbi:protein of unknown function (plasmid) [Caballeronia sp. S22]